jgi:hypothetical protein
MDGVSAPSGVTPKPMNGGSGVIPGAEADEVDTSKGTTS